MERRRLYPISHLTVLIIAGLLLEASYFLLFASRFPVSIASNPQPSFGELILAGRTDAMALVFGLVLLFTPYVVAWRMAFHLPRRPLAIIIVLAFALLFGATMLATYPGGSSDVFHYIFQGRVLSHYHANPFVVAPKDFPNDLVIPYVFWPNVTSIYGPLWTLLSGALTFLAGNNLLLSLLLFKGLGVVFYLMTSLAIYLLVRRDQPGTALPAVLFFAWNPMVIFETAANGHNDITMAFFAVLAFYAIARGRLKTSLALLMLSVLIKFITLFLYPAFILAWITREGNLRSRLREVSAGLVLAGLLAALLYIPFWQGVQTIGPLKQAGLFTSSPATLIWELFRRLGLSQSFSEALPVVLGLLFVIIAIALTLRVRGKTNDLPTICFDIVLAYLMIATMWFQPWYLITLVALAAVVADPQRKVLAVLFSASCLLKYVVTAVFTLKLGQYQMEGLIALAIFAPPAIYLLLGHLSRLRKGREARWALNHRRSLEL